ncbi:hypothetical protein X798_07119, partial [Onchocerca flexuosa]
MDLKYFTRIIHSLNMQPQYIKEQDLKLVQCSEITAMLWHISRIGKRINNMITNGEFRTNHFMSDEMNNNKEYNQGYSKKIFNLIGRGANEYAKPENGYQKIISSKKPFVTKRSQSMIDLENECQKMGHILIQDGLTNIFPTLKKSQITTGKATSLGCVCRTESLKSFKMPTTEGVRRILSHEEVPFHDGIFQISYIGTAEQSQQQNLQYLYRNNALANCQSDELTFGFTSIRSNECYDLTDFNKNCNHKSPNFLQQQPIYSKYGDDIM